MPHARVETPEYAAVLAEAREAARRGPISLDEPLPQKCALLGWVLRLEDIRDAGDGKHRISIPRDEAIRLCRGLVGALKNDEVRAILGDVADAHLEYDSDDTHWLADVAGMQEHGTCH